MPLRWWPLVIIAGLCAGAISGWWFNRPLEPWLNAGHPAATYTPHNQTITIVWNFTVDRPCESDATLHYLLILWDGEVRVFATGGLQLDDGNGQFRGEFGWPEKFDPHGAVIRMIVTCLTSRPEILISPPAPLRFMDFRGLPANPEDFVATRRRKTAHPG